MVKLLLILPLLPLSVSVSLSDCPSVRSIVIVTVIGVVSVSVSRVDEVRELHPKGTG